MIGSIYSEIWELSSNPDVLETRIKLQALTRQLIDIYTAQGRLDDNPFTATTKRKLSLPCHITSLLKMSTCVVTGGLGCVGSRLVNKLLTLGVRQIIIIDNASGIQKQQFKTDQIVHIQADICNLNSLMHVFESFKPDYVFHTAAQRDPGLAESHILDTVKVNVIGTLNVVKACESSSSVKQCVFSSTGKASRYYTEEVYAATKKMCEYILDTYARQSKIKYSAVRFTHILENSLMNLELQNTQNVDYLSIHSPGKYVTAQNVSEAVDLMLNALLSSQVGQCNISLVRHLEWPVESMEVALYYIKQSGCNIPVVFKGNPLGYCEKFFGGQMDWSNPQELNLLINVYECEYKFFNAEGDIIISHIVPTDQQTLVQTMHSIQCANSESTAKLSLLTGLRKLVQAALTNVDRSKTLKILEWGLQPQHMADEKMTSPNINPIVAVLTESLDAPAYMANTERLLQYQNVVNCV